MIELDVALKVGTFNLEMAFRNDDGITALFGHSGSGKSLTLNLIAAPGPGDHHARWPCSR